MLNAYTGLALMLLLSLAGCASNRELAKHTEFRTRISDSGLKHFQLSIAGVRSPERVNATNNMAVRAQQQRPRSRPPREKQLLEILDIKLMENQFCREGHWIIDKSFIPANTFIRGECNESATTTDRNNFPNTLMRW
ncbi:MAG: hypothetical protein KTR17_02285 [Cellvibrionaceae bacterium]|nr:hypothetical protein [Cellvibrionaceae bacterium]